ncbi:IS110 family transposase [uncultured Polaribacter sp.]|uniref:IS110 family transposase n=1 Tax=uncultured Polaribacter sp. TaxID=174711 RepID=UPI00261722D2|nr:IS110 family transposase [uncultured Polaribacter sp.]
MKTLKHIFGVDVSKDKLDLYSSCKGNFVLRNEELGFKKLLKILPENALVVIEATGYYHYLLAQFLVKHNVSVSVVNPLSVKRFIQMKLSQVKTDKSDAKFIYQYALTNKMPEYKVLSEVQFECLQLYRLLDIYVKQSTAIKNKIHGEKVLGFPSKAVIDSLKRNLEYLKNEMTLIEEELVGLISTEYKDQLDLLKTIPGIGNKTAMYLIIISNGFRKFEKGKQLCNYAGITPAIRESGSSVRGKSRISKMGNKKLRNLLFLASFTASKYNRACRELYERIIAKGKSKKLAMIAVANKLIKQAFAVVKKGVVYNENYVSKLYNTENIKVVLE